MTKAKLQEVLQSFRLDEETLSVEMYLLVETNEGDIKTYFPAAEEDKLSDTLSKIVRAQIKNKFFTESDDYEYEVVSANSAESNNIRQVFHIAKSKIPKASLVFDNVVNNQAEDFSKELKLENVWAYIFKAETNSQTIYLFKKNYAVNILKKENSYALFFTNNKLSLLDKDLLRLSKHFDVMLVDKELIILSRSEFEKAFDYVDAMQSTASNNVDVIANSDLIEDIGAISSLSLKKNTLRKLLNINPNSKVLTKTPKQIINLAKKYKVEFKLSDDGSRLSITTKRAATAFVEMLNDDYLKSEFSGSLYKTNGKSAISNS